MDDSSQCEQTKISDQQQVRLSAAKSKVVLLQIIKAAIINIFFIITMSSIKMCNVRGIACSDDP